MTGVNHPYEPPADPDIVVSGDDETSTIDAAKDELLKFIMKHEPTIVI
jgi:adenylylsulfate kinase-like enzyme